VLTIFVVDASGSMALSRMDQAKGALIRLLEKAYVYRDRVALISFRGDGADVLLPPSRSVELAKRALDSLAVGGGTPLAAGLKAALELATRHMAASRTLIVLLTDGRANVGVPEELVRTCDALRAKSIASLVIDSRDRFAAGGETERLANLLGGRRVYLKRPGSDLVYSAVVEATEGLRNHGA
jgi:magnesium chelatase subunit D